MTGFAGEGAAPVAVKTAQRRRVPAPTLRCCHAPLPKSCPVSTCHPSFSPVRGEKRHWRDHPYLVGGGGLDTERNWPLHPRQQILIPVQPPKEWSEGERFSAAEHQNITKIKKNWSNNGLRSLVLTTLLSFCSLLALIYFESNKCQRCHH